MLVIAIAGVRGVRGGFQNHLLRWRGVRISFRSHHLRWRGVPDGSTSDSGLGYCGCAKCAGGVLGTTSYAGEVCEVVFGTPPTLEKCAGLFSEPPPTQVIGTTGGRHSRWFSEPPPMQVVHIPGVRDVRSSLRKREDWTNMHI